MYYNTNIVSLLNKLLLNNMVSEQYAFISSIFDSANSILTEIKKLQSYKIMLPAYLPQI